MSPPLPPSKRQVLAWVDAGKITPEQAVELLRPVKPGSTPPALPEPIPRRLDRKELLGPAPRLRDSLPALRGLALALVVAIGLVILDTVVDRYTGLQGGQLLSWTPLATAAVAGILGLVLPRVRTEAMVVALMLPCLLTFLHPAPKGWMVLGPIVACALVLALRMTPATRISLAVPTLAILLILLMDAFTESEAQTALTLVLAGLYVFALGFAVPFESGWRRVPFGFHAALACTILVGLLVLFVTNLNTTDGDHEPADIDFPDLAGVINGLIILAYPVVTWFAWTHDAARQFQLPSVGPRAAASR